ncbi:MAG TPA: phosphatase PAP2 family protein [Candidatus Saccharimonadales bacterium]|nr:phosphatase PAP2 family protein [Candidatus Saccharimonadales bacterium]
MHKDLISFFANYFFIFPLLWAAYIMLELKVRRGEYIVRTVCAGITAVVFAAIGMKLYHHARPYVLSHVQALAINPHNNSFPSLHALLITAAALVVYLATKNWWYFIVLVATDAVVAWARILAHVHFLTDIIGGVLMSIVAVAIWFWVPLPDFLKQLSKTTGTWLDRKIPVRK